MKKFIVCTLMLFFAAISIQAATPDTSVNPDVKYIVDKIETGINKVATDLHVQPEQVYSILEKQAEVEMQKHLILYISFLIFAICALIIGMKLYVRYDPDDLEFVAGVILIIIGSIAAVGWTIAFAATFGDFLTLLNNPSYWIIQQLIL